MGNLKTFIGLTFFTGVLLFVAGLYSAETTEDCYETYTGEQIANMTQSQSMAYQNEINECVKQFALPWWIWAFFLTPIAVGLAIYVAPFIGG